MQAGAVKKVLIANRREIALRAVRAYHSLSIYSVAVYSTADVSTPHVWAATQAVSIGPPSNKKSYLNADAFSRVTEVWMRCGLSWVLLSIPPIGIEYWVRLNLAAVEG